MYFIRDYDSIQFFSTVRKAVEELKTHYLCPQKFVNDSPIYTAEPTPENVSISEFIEKVTLSKEEIKEIEQKIDELVRKQEEANRKTERDIAEGRPVAFMTGNYPIYTIKNRQEYIDQEIRFRSYKWK